MTDDAILTINIHVFYQDNPALIALTLAESIRTAERDKGLTVEEAKQAAAVRSYLQKIEAMTRPELKREVEIYKKRREQVHSEDLIHDPLELFTAIYIVT